MSNVYELAADELFARPTRPAGVPAPIGAPLAKPARDPYAEAADELRRSQGLAQVRPVLDTAVRRNPDQAAEAAKLGKRYSVLPDVLYNNLPEAKARAAADQAEDALLLAPRLQKYLGDRPDTVAQTHDDLKSLSDIEQLLDLFVVRPLKATPALVGVSSYGGMELLLRATVEPIGDLLSGQTREAPWLRLLPGNPFAPIIEAVRSKRRQEQASVENTLGEPPEGYEWVRPVQSGLISAATNVPLILAGALLKRPDLILPIMGGLAGGAAGPEALDAGVDPGRALLYAVQQGGLEAAFEKGPLDALLKYFAAPAGGHAVREFAKMLAAQYAVEIPHELATTLTTNANEWATLNPGKSTAEFLREQPADLLDTLISTVVGVGLQTSAVGAGAAAANKLAGGGRKEEEDGATIKALLAASQRALLRERNPEEFREVMRELASRPDGSEVQVYVAGEVLAQLPLEVIQQLPESVWSEITPAADTGDRVAIPLSAVLAVAPGTPLEQAVQEHGVLNPFDQSPAEINAERDQSQALAQQRIEEVISAAANQERTREQIESVRQQLADQLAATGRHSRAVSDAMAIWAASFYATMGARTGRTAEQFYQQYPLRIAGERGGATGPVLNAARPGRLDDVEAFHYSPRDLSAVDTSSFGTGLLGSGRDTYLNAADPRLRRRAYFYVDKGTGVTPEQGVGGRGHRARLSNIYDSNTDPLRLKEGKDQLGFESAVLDAGFAGYLDRLSGSQPGQVVLLGGQSVPVENLGPLAATTGKLVPPQGARESRGRDLTVDALRARADLPSGELSLQRWGELLEKLAPTEHAALKEAGVFEGDETLYKDGLVKRFVDRTEAPVYGQQGKESGPKVKLPTKAGTTAAIDIREGPGLTGNQRMSVHEVAAFFDRITGKRDFNDPKEKKRALKQLVAELRYQMQQEKSGLDWYDEDIELSFRETATVIPSLTDNEAKRQLLLVVVGLQSPGTKADLNWDIGAQAFQHYENTGVIPARNPTNGSLWAGGPVSATKEKSLTFLNAMVQDLGEAAAVEWLYSEHTVKELNEARAKWGKMGPSVDGKATDTALGLRAFGPKVGPFVMNLNGIHEVTVDVWATRTFHRYFGQMQGPDGKIVDGPTEPERRVVKELFNAAATELGVKPYQVQALAWFFEQQLFSKLGTASASLNFSDGARKFAARGRGDVRGGDGPAENVLGQGPLSPLVRGTFLNVGLSTAEVAGEGQITAEQVTQELESRGVRVVNIDQHQSNTELTAVVEIDRPLTPEEADSVSAALQQEAIVQLSDGVGNLHGPKAAEWGPYNPDFFLLPNGQTAADAASQGYRQSTPWYSELARQVAAAPMKSAPASGWAQWLKGLAQKGVSPDEIEWSGISEWLTFQEGKVTREQVGAYLKANGVRVKQVVYADLADRMDQINDAIAEYGYAASYEGNDQVEFVDEDGEIVDWDHLPEDVVDAVRSVFPSWVKGSTRYTEYTDPKGTNNREILLALPRRGPTPQGLAKRKAVFDKYQPRLDALRVKAESLAGKDSAAYGIAHGQMLDLQSKRDAEADAAYRLPADEKPYRSGHWEEPDVLAHTRVNDRVDVDGRRVLVVEELQSDWAQAGRERGFAEDFDQAAVRRAPFVGSTDKWLALAMKRIIKMAVDEGYGAVAFVTGDQSAERYDLSKQIDAIDYRRITVGAGDEIDLQLIKDGKILKTVAVREAELADHVGKEMAAKILQGEGSQQPARNGGEPMTRLDGLNLKVGGEGMRAFYDEIVPAAAKKLLRKLGGEGLVDIELTETDKRQGFLITDKMKEAAAGGLPLFSESARGTFNPATLELVLNPNANLSTWFHETGHFFLEVLADIASQPDAPAGIAADMGTVLQWFGVSDLQTWQGMTLDQKREHHEKWARGVEQYVMEGKAPSAEMLPLLRRFAAWMKSVYGSIQRFLAGLPEGERKPLNDDIRRVMDRLIATDEQIAEAEQIAGMTPDPSATALAGEKLAKRSLASLKWAVRARGEAIKKLQGEAKAARKAAVEAATEEVDATPEMRALKALEALRVDVELQGRLDAWKDARTAAEEASRLEIQQQHLAAEEAKTGAALTGLKKGQFLAKVRGEVNAEVSLAMIKWDRQNPKPLRRADPNDAEMAVIADSFGFPTVEAMMEAIEAFGNRRDAIDSIAELRMLEEHGDLNDADAIAEAANLAVHNEARARALAAELRSQQEALAAKADTGQTTAGGRKTTVNILVEAGKRFAAEVVSRTPLRDLKAAAWQHTAAEKRASQRWLKATMAGKTEEAVKAKQDQLLHNLTSKALLEAQAEGAQIRAFFARVVRGTDEKVVEKGRDPDLVNAARAVLFAYGIQTPATKKASAYLSVVAQHDPETYNAVSSMVAAAVENAQPVDSLAFEELRSLHEAVASLWHLAKRSRRIEVAGDVLDIDDAAAMLSARLDEKRAPTTLPGTTGTFTKAEERARALQFFGAALRRVEQWVGSVDGKYGGPFQRIVFQPVKDAADRYRTDRLAYRRKFQALVKGVAPSLSPNEIAAPTLGYVFGKGGRGGHAELLHALLHTGNASNKRKLLLGRGWATENEDGTLDTTRWDAFLGRLHDTGVLRREHYDFVQGVWDLLEETKAGAQKAHRDAFGRYFSEVTADAFDTPFGTYRGGYVPALVDPRLVQDAEQRELIEQDNASLTSAFPSTARGFTYSRAEYNRPLLLDLRVLPQHIDKVLLFTHMENPVRQTARVLRRPGVQDKLNALQPGAISGMLRPWLNRAARQMVNSPVVGDGGLSRIATVARARAGMQLMFANVSNTLQQFTGLSNLLVQVRPGHVGRAVALYLQNPRKMVRDVHALSPMMAERASNEVAAISGQIEQILLNPTLLERAQDWAIRHAYFMQLAVDNVIGPIAWTGAYNQALSAGMEEADAIRFADGVVRQTQTSSLPEDISRVEAGPPAVRLFTQFYNYFSMLFNTNVTAMQQIVEEVGIVKGAHRLAFVGLAGLLIPFWVAEAIAVAMRGGPEDDEDDGYLDDWIEAVIGMGTAKGFLAGIPVAGQFGIAAVNRFNATPVDDRVSLSPAVSLAEASVGVPAHVYKAATEGVEAVNARRAVRDMLTLLGMVLGLPLYAAARPLGYLAGVTQESIIPTDPVDAARGLVTGTPSPESKQ
jgi:hypothetical protein